MPWRRHLGRGRSLPGLATVKIHTSSPGFQDPKMLGAVAKTGKEPPSRLFIRGGVGEGCNVLAPECPQDCFRHWLPVLGQQAKPRLLSFPWPWSGIGPLLPPGCLLGTEPVVWLMPRKPGGSHPFCPGSPPSSTEHPLPQHPPGTGSTGVPIPNPLIQPPYRLFLNEHMPAFNMFMYRVYPCITALTFYTHCKTDFKLFR